MKVVYKNGKILTPQLELNAAEHCNLRCVECSHLSPYVPTALAETAWVRRDLAALAPVLHCEAFRFVGGEPLLNKNLLELVRAVRESAIADRIVVVSNGTLIDRIGDDFFQSIDALDISRYPETDVDAAKIDIARTRCARFAVQLSVNDKPQFRKVQIDREIEDEAIVRMIYGSCRNAHMSVCHAFHNGYYYKCSRPIFSDRYLALKGTPVQDLAHADGVSLHGADLLARLASYIEEEAPLRSCRYCLGTAGKNVTQRQMSREEARSAEADPRPAGELLDWKLLRFDLRLRRVLDGIDGIVPNPSIRHALMRVADRLRPKRTRME
ncbi:MAG TPA: 4Fe-4S cluster-binding domain-containing protein [Candidatus Binatia bacterium]